MLVEKVYDIVKIKKHHVPKIRNKDLTTLKALRCGNLTAMAARQRHLKRLLKT